MPCVKCREVSDGESPHHQATETAVYTWSHVLWACPVGGVPGMTVRAPSSCLWGYKACTHVVWCRKLAWQCCPLLWRSVSPVGVQGSAASCMWRSVSPVGVQGSAASCMWRSVSPVGVQGSAASCMWRSVSPVGVQGSAARIPLCPHILLFSPVR